LRRDGAFTIAQDPIGTGAHTVLAFTHAGLAARIGIATFRITVGDVVTAVARAAAAIVCADVAVVAYNRNSPLALTAATGASGGAGVAIVARGALIDGLDHAVAAAGIAGANEAGIVDRITTDH
jgi:hypothetical protein